MTKSTPTTDTFTSFDRERVLRQLVEDDFEPAFEIYMDTLGLSMTKTAPKANTTAQMERYEEHLRQNWTTDGERKPATPIQQRYEQWWRESSSSPIQVRYGPHCIYCNDSLFCTSSGGHVYDYSGLSV